MSGGWARERWYEFRTGHSTYLIFILTFVNFVLISYRLLIEKISFFKELIPELWMFTLLFLSLYIPAAIIIGYWHRHTQLKIEQTISMHQNPFYAKMFRVLIDVQLGNISKEEIDKFRNLLLSIEKKMDYVNED